MLKTSDGATYPVQRKHRRYDLQCPVRLQFPEAYSRSSLDTLSRNVSLGGMLLDSSVRVPKDAPVLLTMMLEGELMTRPVQISAEGRVVRIAQNESGFAIAVACTRPLSRIESLLAPPQHSR